MPIPDHILSAILRQDLGDAPTAQVKRGDAIFDGTDYPRTFDDFIGQEKAKEQLRVQVASATMRGARIEHTLLASGIAGVGKSTLATLLAYEAGVGLVRASGQLTLADFQGLLLGLQDRDLVFFDELHTLVQGNKTRTDWLLPFMTEGKLYTKNGVVGCPDVAIVGATTDVGRLPDTLVSRFMSQPQIVAYTDDEAAEIALSLAGRMGVLDAITSEDDFVAIARAADGNPRMMRQILTAVRDLGFAYPDTKPNLEKALEWVGVSADGLSMTARDVLLCLFATPEFTASIDAIKAQLNEPGPLRYPEQQLLQRGLMVVTGRGRQLTEAGIARARQEARRR